jgi:hypothetical protein
MRAARERSDHKQEKFFACIGRTSEAHRS